MSLAKIKIGCLFLAIFFCLFLSAAIYAVDNDEMMPPERDNVSLNVLSQNRGKMELLVRDEGLYKPWMWGNDVQIATGSVEGGISAAYDFDANMYAARCTTYDGIERNRVMIYKSTDLGETWQVFKHFYNPDGYQYSYPQLVVCESGSNEYLYVFHLRSDLNGHVRLAKYTLGGITSGYYTVASGGSDTITYYSACSDVDGDTLFVTYEIHESGDPTPNIHFIRSTNYGTNWSGDKLVDIDGAQPDIAYSVDGYLFLAVQDITPEHDIQLWRSTDYGTSWSGKDLTSDEEDNSYPKVAALHVSPANTAIVWVTYNHYTTSTDVDLRYAYSTNGGSNWTKNQVLASSTTYDEMASEVFTHRWLGWTIVYVCYLKYRFTVSPFVETSNIYTAWTSTDDPTNWRDLTQINDHMAAYSRDGREVCQGAIYPYIIFPVPGIVYASKPYLIGNFDDLYFDGYSFVGVEDEEDEGTAPSEFSLSHNYPNPFNPETKIQYTVGSKQTEAADGGQRTADGSLVHTTLKIYNILGQMVRTLVDESKGAGTYEVIWDGKDENGNEVASGVYFYKLVADDFSQTKKMVLIR